MTETCSICGREYVGGAAMASHERSCENQRENIEELSRLYWDEGLGLRNAAEKIGVSTMTARKWLIDNEYGSRSHQEACGVLHPWFGIKDGGYYYAGSKVDGREKHVRIHDLVAIAHGADPYEVFGRGGKIVHHDGHIRWDNRPENLIVMSNSDHASLHRKREKIHPDEWDIAWRD